MINDLIWQVKIKITQAPEPFIPDLIDEHTLLEWQVPNRVRSFLFDPVNSTPPSAYGLHLKLNKRFDLIFFTRVNSEEEGYEIGQAWLSSLRYRFTGLDGTIEVSQIEPNEQINANNKKIFEVALPRGLAVQRIDLIERFINLFYNHRESLIEMVIIWKRDHNKNNPKDISNLYHTSIFIILDSNQENHNFAKLKGLIQFLIQDIKTTENQIAVLNEDKSHSYSDIITCGIFSYEKSSENTFIKEDFNFDIPETIPLPRMPILDKENVRYIDLDQEFIKNSISIGYHVKDGLITSHKTYVPIKKLAQDVAIFGKSGTGKTYFLAGFIRELCEKADKVGILVLNVAKESQQVYYENFKVLRYLDKDFHIPYYLEGRSSEKSLQETATYICASLGLKNVFEKIIYRTMKTLIRIKGKLPELFIDLLIAVEHYVAQNPYGSEVQSNLIQALRNRIKVFDEGYIQNVMRLQESLPHWIEDWLKGGKIFLDLSMCNKFTKMVIVNAILQIIRTITKDIEIEQLKHLIVIDEAHAILEKPITTNSDDADFIMKEQMAKIFSEILKEYRSRGIGLIIADQSPKKLFDDVYSQPSIKVIFREDFPNNILFSEDLKERDILTCISNRIALVKNGATGEYYLLYSLFIEF